MTSEMSGKHYREDRPEMAHDAGPDLNEDRGGFRLFIKYTLMFCIMAGCVFAMLIITHRTFLRYGDGYRQGYFWVVEYRNIIKGILAGDGFSLWSWSRGPGLEYGLFFLLDPFNLLSAIFPVRYLELGITCASLLRMYFAGLAFMYFGREMGFTSNQKFIGSMGYAFTGWVIEVALCQSQFTMNAVLFPLLVCGVEKVYKRKSPALFILTVAYYLMCNMYFAYMAAIIIIIYILVRYFAYHTRRRKIYEVEPYMYKGSFGAYLKNIVRFFLYGITGVLISAFAILPTAQSLLNASMDSGLTYMRSLFDASYYLDIGLRVLGRGMTYDYMDLGIPILLLLLFPVAFRKLSRKSTHIVMFVILALFYVFPKLCSVLNGFSYPTTRWVFTLIFFMIWAAIEQFDTETLFSWKSIVLMVLMFIVLAGSTEGLFQMGKIGFGITDTLFVPIQLGAGVIMIVVIIVMTIKKSEAAGAKWLTRIAALVMIISLAAGWNYGFYNNIDDFNRNSSVYKRLQTSVQRAGNKIQDDDFFRVDAKEGLQQRAVVKYPPNENAWWRTNTLYIYNSRVPSSLLEFNKAVGNNYGYSRRVAVLSNGNRMGLDFLFGVKYYLGNDSREEDYDSNSFTDPYYREPDNYAGYGFVKAYDIDGVSVFKSKYDAGLGFVYDKVISYSEFMKLSRLEREQALLQAAVIPDNELSDVSDIQEVKATDIDLDVKEIPFKIVGTENLTISGNTIKVGDDGGYITIKPEDHSNCQLVVSFDNLRKTSGSASFDVTSEDGRHFVTACNERSRQSITGIVDFDLNMGYYESRSGEIKVGLTSGGTYTFDKFYVSAMSTANYDEYAAKCSENRLKVTEYDDSHVKGYVDSAGGVLFLSIPANDNWDIYIDGSKVERLEKIAITFFGAKIGAGHHEIELKYQNKLMYLGAIISAVGLVLFLIIVIVVAVRRRRERRELNPDQNQDQAQGL